MYKPLDAERYATLRASYVGYDDLLRMAPLEAHNSGLALVDWVDDALDDTMCEALGELTETFPDWSGIGPADRHSI